MVRTSAAIDENDVKSLLAVSSADGESIVVVWADPVTHALLVTNVSSSITGLIEPGTNITITGLGTTGDPYVINSTGGSSPLTTKGDIYGHSTVDARIPVGTNGQILSANSACALGVAWENPPPSGLTVGTTPIAGGSSGNVEYNNGGTLGEYVASSSNTGSALVLRDSAGNAAFNNVISTVTQTVTSGQTISMTYGSSGGQEVSGTHNITFNLPDSTYLFRGEQYQFNNNSTGTITIYLNDGSTLLGTVPSMGFGVAICDNNTTSDGEWDLHYWLPTSGMLSSPLTTKGDLWGFSSTNARIPVGTNGQLLAACSSCTLGVEWVNAPSGGTPAGNCGDIQINVAGSFGTIGGGNLDLTGNARGCHSLDLQSKRTAATQVASGACSFAFGYKNTASGAYSTASGYYNNAVGNGSLAIGVSNTACSYALAIGFGNNTSGTYSSAFGYCNTASGYYSSLLGVCNGGNTGCTTWMTCSCSSYCSVPVDTSTNTQIGIGICNNVFVTSCGSSSTYSNYAPVINRGNCSVSVGVNNNSASGYNNGPYQVGGDISFAGGNNNTSSGCGSAAVGFENTASGHYANVFGTSNLASNVATTAVGYGNFAYGVDSTAVGFFNTACGCKSVASGYTNTASACLASASGAYNTASGFKSSAFGYCNTASCGQSFASGYYNTASGYYSTAIGHHNTASGLYGTAVGHHNTASCTFSTAVGSNNISCSFRSSAFGYGNTASGQYSTASGYVNLATAKLAAVFGSYNTASACATTALGYGNTVSGTYSTAIGYSNTACGCYSSVFGYGVTNATACTTAIGYCGDVLTVGVGKMNKTPNLPTGTLVSPPSGLAIGDLWLDTTTSAQYPIVRFRAT